MLGFFSLSFYTFLILHLCNLVSIESLAFRFMFLIIGILVLLYERFSSAHKDENLENHRVIYELVFRGMFPRFNFILSVSLGLLPLVCIMGLSHLISWSKVFGFFLFYLSLVIVKKRLTPFVLKEMIKLNRDISESTFFHQKRSMVDPVKVATKLLAEAHPSEVSLKIFHKLKKLVDNGTLSRETLKYVQVEMERRGLLILDAETLLKLDHLDRVQVEGMGTIVKTLLLGSAVYAGHDTYERVTDYNSIITQGLERDFYGLPTSFDRNSSIIVRELLTNRDGDDIIAELLFHGVIEDGKPFKSEDIFLSYDDAREFTNSSIKPGVKLVPNPNGGSLLAIKR